MLRYVADFGSEYFVEYFRRNNKFTACRVATFNEKEVAPFISVCTTSMNRLHDLRQTLPKNLEDNAQYPCAEFVLLDYNSVDGTEQWVHDNLMKYIREGRLVYYRAKSQRYFRPNHSRNMSFRLARGDVIANVDADNYTDAGFLDRLAQCFLACDKVIALPESFLNPTSRRLALRGRFAVRRADLFALGGFDEELDSGYSHDDVSFVFRAMLDRFSLVRFEDRFMQCRIETPEQERIANMAVADFQQSKQHNALLTRDKLGRCEILVNRGRFWGAGSVIKNFTETITLGDESAT